MADWTLAPADAGMLDDLAGIEAACFAHPWSRELLESELAREDAVILCALAAGRPVAYGSMRVVLDEGSIGNLACLPDYRHRGAGGMVLDGLLAAGAEQGARSILLEVRPSNTAAVRLYQSRGFSEIGRRKHFYRDPLEDAILMMRCLTGPISPEGPEG